MRILIVKVSALGDVVHALPVLPFLKSADPAMEIDWLVEEAFAPLLEGNPLIRKVHRLRTREWRRQGAAGSVKGAWNAVREMRRERYDIVLDLQGNSKSGFFTRFADAPLRYGFARSGIREWPNLLASNRKVELGEGDFHISDRSLAVARHAFPSGNEVIQAGPLPVNPEAKVLVEKIIEKEGLQAGNVIVFHYGTTWKTKLWPLGQWRILAREVADRTGLKPVLTWGNEEEFAAVEDIRKATGGRAVIWPRGALQELVALLARADLVVGGDTGPVHIAAAAGTPTLSLFRATDAERNGPRGDGHIRLQAPLDCSPCLKKECERDEECGRSIPVELVLKGILSLVKENAS